MNSVFIINIDTRAHCTVHNKYRDWCLQLEEELKKEEQKQQEELEELH
jgi:hypothetical protein